MRISIQMKNANQITLFTQLHIAAMNLTNSVPLVGWTMILLIVDVSSALFLPAEATFTTGVAQAAFHVKDILQITPAHDFGTQKTISLNQPNPKHTFVGSSLRELHVTGNQLEPQAQFQGLLISLSPDNKFVLTYVPGATRLYEISGKLIAQFPGTPSDFKGFSPNGKLVLTSAGGRYGSYLHDLSGKLIAQFKSHAVFSPDGRLILASDTQKSLLYNLSGKQLAQFQGQVASFSPDGNFVFTQVTGSEGYRLYDLSGKQLGELTGGPLKFSPDGKLVLTAGYEVTYLYNLSGQLLLKFRGASRSFSPDGKFVLTGAGCVFCLYDLSGKQITQFPDGELTFSPDARFVLITDAKDSRLYDLSGKQITQFKGNNAYFSPDGQFVWIGQNDRIRLYNLAGVLLTQFQGDKLNFSPNGNLVVTDAADGSRLYDVSGKEVAKLRGHLPSFSPNRQFVRTFYGENSLLYKLPLQSLSDQPATLQAVFSEKSESKISLIRRPIKTARPALTSDHSARLSNVVARFRVASR